MQLVRVVFGEPMVQFLLAAFILFAVDAMYDGSPMRPAGNRVLVSAGQVNKIAENFQLLSGRPPSRGELEALVKDYADEEIFYREAVAMGLDIDDVIVRRRMRQKLEFLSEEDDISEPSDAQLETWLTTHRADYRMPRRVAFRQVLASGDVRGLATKADAEAFAARLNGGADAASIGDGSLLPSTMPLSSQQDIASQFGNEFAAGVFRHSGRAWFGPVMSPFGAHAVLITATEAGRDPSLQEVRDKLRSGWVDARRQDQRQKFTARLRARYRVTIDWPNDHDRQ
ncbi:MAG: peptidyl-prolyl cis-trans isomerase [Sphingobium sp.]